MTSDEFGAGSAGLRSKKGFDRLVQRDSVLKAEIDTGLRLSIHTAQPPTDSVALRSELQSTLSIYNRAGLSIDQAQNTTNFAASALSELSELAYNANSYTESSATNEVSQSQREALNDEVARIADRFAEVAATTVHGSAIFDGSFQQSVQVGSRVGDRATFSEPNLNGLASGSGSLENVDISSLSAATTAESTTEEFYYRVITAATQSYAAQDNLYTEELLNQTKTTITEVALDSVQNVDLDSAQVELQKLEAIKPIAAQAYADAVTEPERNLLLFDKLGKIGEEA